MNLIMYFTVNTAFTNYLDQSNLTEELEFLVITNKTTSEFTLPVFLNKSKFDESLLTAPQTLKNYIAKYKQEKEIFNLKERHDIDELEIFCYRYICIHNSNNIGYNNNNNNIHFM